jgi:type VI secretion system Hcp family effector
MPFLKIIRLLLLTATTLLFAQSSFGAEYFNLDIPTIRGESQLSSHPTTIDCAGFSLNCTNSGAGVVFGDLVVTKLLDKASPPLFLASAQSTTLSSVILYVSRYNGGPLVDYYTIKLTNAKVSSVSQNDAGDGAAENITFRYQRIEVDYVPYIGTQAQQTVVMRWDLVTNQQF